MKFLKIHFLLFFTILVSFMQLAAQPINNYESDWKLVNDNINKGLPASALEYVKKIYSKAKKDKQDAQIVKSLVYLVQLQQENRDNNINLSILEIEKEITTSKEPVSALLKNYLAGLYQQYFANNRYKLYNRTNTVDFKKDDIATWTIEDFHRKISALYLTSIKDEKMLQQVKLNTFDAIIEKGNVRYLRPTLFDLLAHHALNYFKSDERDITKTTYSFEINQPYALSSAEEFVTANFETKDSLSLQHKALLIYQDLIRFHLNDVKPDALIDLDIERLQYVYSKMQIPQSTALPLYIIDGKASAGLSSIQPDDIKSITVLKGSAAVAAYGNEAEDGVVVITTKSQKYNASVMSKTKSKIEGKDLLYYTALQNIVSKYVNEPATTQAQYLIAEIHHQKGNKYNANSDTTNRYELLTAKKIADKILEQKEESQGWVNAYNLNRQLTLPSFSFDVEAVNLPEIPFRMLVQFKNISKLYLRIIPATETIKNIMQNFNEREHKWNQLAGIKPLKKWQQELPKNDDLQTHSTEIKIDGLPLGEFFVFASLDENFSTAKNILAAQLVYISNISYVSNNEDFFILHRNTGQPIARATVEVFNQVYDYSTSKTKRQLVDTYTSDKNGYFKLGSKITAYKQNGNRNNSLLFNIKCNKDQLFIYNDGYYYFNNQNENYNKQTQNSGFLFTDRSIYRPGQTIYFKGIAISRRNDGRKASINKDYKTTLTLYDANYQKVSDMQVQVNEYGSFSGKFTLPLSGLNGVYALRTSDNSGNATLRMEEYKRPKFYVDFEKPKGAYKLNEKVKVTGFAKAYAGNNIDGAKVKFRVVREVRFPYPWLFWRGYLPQTEAMEITNGEIETDTDGKFDISFNAIPDLQLDSKLDPVFDYKIYADVSDINGETRSSSQLVSAGYKSLLLSVKLPTRLSTDSLHKIQVTTTNMAGVFEKATISVKIIQLQAEQRLLRPRYWGQPDQFILSKEEYIQQFPNDIYNNENDPNTWERGATIIEQTGTTDSSGVFILNKTDFKPGYYTIETTTTDKDNNKIKNIQYTEVFDSKSTELFYPQYLSTIAPNPIAPGEKTKTAIRTSAKDIFLIQQIEKDSSSYSFHKLKNSKTFDFTATEADRGGYGASYLFVKNNRVFQVSQNIVVPWSNKQLDIAFSTFRDKTLPGAEEKWTIKISGHNKEKIAAEALVSMYDASLDQFNAHQWAVPYVWENFYNRQSWRYNTNFIKFTAAPYVNINIPYKSFNKSYDHLIYGNYGWDNSIAFESAMPGIRVRGALSREFDKEEVASVGYGLAKNSTKIGAAAPVNADAVEQIAPSLDAGEKKGTGITAMQVRSNFNETAFFFPDLQTDKEGNINFSFTMPEALTQWKLQALAHTKDVAFGYNQKEVITQKDLMVQPNPPRFLREGDKMDFSSKLVNLSGKEISGTASLLLMDATTNEPINHLFKNDASQIHFNIKAGQSKAVLFPISIPYNYNQALTWRIVAQTKDGALSDGEENVLPVLTNRMLVTETLPLSMRGSGTKKFKLDKLINSANSKTLTTQSLTVEYTSNPAWYAVQALPYMMEYPYECAEQTWNRYYANTLATLIANSSPKIKQIFEQWETKDTAALLSNLQKNQELKAVLLEETPWVLAAKTEAQQKKNLTVLFDLIRMSGELSKAYDKLRQLQSSNGGFVWFKGGPDDRYMTQYIVTGIGHLKKLKAITGLQEANLNRIVQQALPYLDGKIKEEYDNLIKNKVKIEEYTPSYYVIQYLYMRSFFPQIKITSDALKAVTFFTERSSKTWIQQNKYMQAMVALSTHRNGNISTATSILKSLKETSITNEEMGMYYKDASRSWWWYDAPIERQALIIEAFEEVDKNSKIADDLRTWLLKNKQTNNWESTKATAEAVYALLLRGTDWLTVSPEVNINLGDINLISKNNNNEAEAGSGYFKKIIEGPNVHPSMGNIEIKVQQPSNSTLPIWGGVYWQYFEDLDKITTATTPLQITKRIFIETNTDNGPVLRPINENDKIKVGDKIKVRIELRVDRDMEYVHMKDMRAATFEPTNVLSSYKWQGGLGYYETTKDASTNFFFNYLNKGTYVFEYSLFTQLSGNFSNGITSIQCMYAPEFSAHSEGIRVQVK